MNCGYTEQPSPPGGHGEGRRGGVWGTADQGSALEATGVWGFGLGRLGGSEPPGGLGVLTEPSSWDSSTPPQRAPSAPLMSFIALGRPWAALEEGISEGPCGCLAWNPDTPLALPSLGPAGRGGGPDASRGAVFGRQGGPGPCLLPAMSACAPLGKDAQLLPEGAETAVRGAGLRLTLL